MSVAVVTGANKGIGLGVVSREGKETRIGARRMRQGKGAGIGARGRSKSKK